MKNAKDANRNPEAGALYLELKCHGKEPREGRSVHTNSPPPKTSSVWPPPAGPELFTRHPPAPRLIIRSV